MSTDLMSLIHEAGFRGDSANIMYAIVMAESGGNVMAHNTNANTGDNSYGLAQINMLGSMGPDRLRQYGLSSNDDLFDPLTNLKVAYAMSGHGTHWGDWSTYNSGAYTKFLGQSGAQVTSTPSGGSGGGGNTNVRTAAATAQDYKSVDSLGALLTKVPDLNKILKQAQAGNWSIQKFENAIEDSAWWKNNSSTARSILIQQANDPASYNQRLQNLTGNLGDLARQLGFKIDPDVLNSIATTAMLSGNDTNQGWLTRALGRHEDYKTADPDKLGGQMAQTYQQLQQLSAAYGLSYSDQSLLHAAQMVVTGAQTIDYFKQHYIATAKSKFPSIAEQLDAGQTVRDIADPYMQSMSQLLEVNPNTITIDSPLVKRALQGVNVAGSHGNTPQVMSLGAFETQVRNDPRWQYTQNAKDTFSTALTKIGQDFGFGGYL